MGKVKQLLIEDVVLAQIINEAIDSGDYITCDRCELLVPADQLFGAVCHDCANDLIEEGLEREQKEMEDALVDKVLAELREEFLMQEALDDLLLELALEDLYKDVIKSSVPVGAFDLDLFL